MRDPERIEAVTFLIRRIWGYFPDMRYFQLMHCIEVEMGIMANASLRFNCEDTTTEQFLSDLLRRIEDNHGRWPW